MNNQEVKEYAIDLFMCLASVGIYIGIHALFSVYPEGLMRI